MQVDCSTKLFHMLHVIPVRPLDIEATAKLKPGFIQDRKLYPICIAEEFKNILRNAEHSWEGITTTFDIPEEQIDFWIKYRDGLAQEASFAENYYLFVPENAFLDWKKWLMSDSEEGIIFYEPIWDPTIPPVATLCQAESFGAYSISLA